MESGEIVVIFSPGGHRTDQLHELGQTESPDQELRGITLLLAELAGMYSDPFSETSLRMLDQALTKCEKCANLNK